jgi:tRNA pseudouridine38-40 synthase
MAHYQSIVAYDGTDFWGFQRQGSNRRTVQQVLETALAGIGWTGPSLRAAGRTDSGVHARGQVVSYAIDWHRGPERLTRALNAHLPPDVAVRETAPAPEDFHPRFSARSRRYSYTVFAAPTPDPIRDRFCWRIWPELNLSAMRVAAEIVVGEHDFGAFGKPPIRGGHTLRTVTEAVWRGEGIAVVFEIEADAFLYRMVRRLVAAMVDIGRGAREMDHLCASLEDPRRKWVGRLAPAKGLCLEHIAY